MLTTLKNLTLVVFTVVAVSTTLGSAFAKDCRISSQEPTDKTFDLSGRGLHVYGTLVNDGTDRLDICLGYKSCSWGPITSSLQQMVGLRPYLGPGFCYQKAKQGNATEINVFCDAGYDFKVDGTVDLLNSVPPLPQCKPPFMLSQHNATFFFAPIISDTSICVLMALRSDDFIPFYFVVPTCEEGSLAGLVAGGTQFDFSKSSSPHGRIVVITKTGFGWASLFDDSLKVKTPDLFIGYSSDDVTLKKWLAAILTASESKTPLPKSELPIANISADNQTTRILQWYGAAVIRVSSQEPTLRSSARNWMARAAIDPSNAFKDTLLRTELLP